MTRKEKQKLMLDTLGLKAGDIIELQEYDHEKFEVVECEELYSLKNKDETLESLYSLILYDFIKIVPKKKKGELQCFNFEDCHECPLHTLRCERGSMSDRLYKILESTKNYYKLDQRIYDAYKEILDEEMEEKK